MGTFDTGAFDNDSALDWIDGFKARKAVKAVSRTLHDYPAKVEAEAAIAAMEVLAALRGFPSEDLDAEIDEWAEKQRLKAVDLGDAGSIALLHLAAILETSEIAELWAETDHLEAWRAGVLDLKERLERSPRPASERQPRRSPSVVATAKLREPVRVKVTSLGLKLPPHLASTCHTIEVNLCQDFTPEELSSLIAFLREHPSIEIRLVDFPRKRGKKLTEEALLPFSDAVKLELNSETLPSIGVLRRFHELKELELSRMNAARGVLDVLPDLNKLGRLSLYCLSEPAGQALSRLGSLTALESLRLQPVIVTFGAPNDSERLPISWIAELRRLRWLELKNMRTTDTSLDLRSLENLDHIDLGSLPDLSVLSLPAGAGVVAVQDCANVSIAFPDGATRVRQVVSDDARQLGELSAFAGSPTLRAVSLANVDERHCRVVSELPAVESIHLFGPCRIPLSFRSAASLRFLQLWDWALDVSIEAAASAPALEELALFNDMDSLDWSLDTFGPLKGHPTLKRVRAAPFDRMAELTEFLGLDPGYEERERAFLADL